MATVAMSSGHIVGERAATDIVGAPHAGDHHQV